MFKVHSKIEGKIWSSPISHPLTLQFPLSASLTREVHLLQLMIVTQDHGLFGVHSWCCIFCGFEQMYKDSYHCSIARVLSLL